MGHFGTDGIRKKASAFSEEYLNKIADGIAALGGETYLIGRDPRESGPYLSDVLTKRLASRGKTVVDIGMVPTPCLSYLTSFLGADYGIVLSASHNPPEYNGVKLFNSVGEKVSAEEEKAVEKVIDGDFSFAPAPAGKIVKKDAAEEYIAYLLSAVKPDFSGLTVLLDAANGATAIIAPEIFRRAGATVILKNGETDGKNINIGCGATVPSFIAEESKDPAVDIAFCYDGDGDRVMAAVDGKIYDGDKMMYLCAKDMAKRGKLTKNTVVGTVMSNMGTEIAMKNAGITLVRADVGDKYVSREMKKGGYNLGGEQSGHLIYADYMPTGDGILSSLLLTDLFKRVDLRTYDDIIDYPAVNDCVLCDDAGKKRFLDREGEIAAFVKSLTDCRTVVRPSGTEPKIRILAEAKTEEIARARADRIKKFIEEMIV